MHPHKQAKGGGNQQKNNYKKNIKSSTEKTRKTVADFSTYNRLKNAPPRASIIHQPCTYLIAPKASGTRQK